MSKSFSKMMNLAMFGWLISHPFRRFLCHAFRLLLVYGKEFINLPLTFQWPILNIEAEMSTSLMIPSISQKYSSILSKKWILRLDSAKFILYSAPRWKKRSELHFLQKRLRNTGLDDFFKSSVGLIFNGQAQCLYFHPYWLG